jgi:hypothetical protein
MFRRRKKRDEQQGAATEQRAHDPRLDVPSIGYRFARPADIVEAAEGTTVAGPGGSPEDPLDAQRRVS